MRISTLNVTNYRCFEELKLSFSNRINVFVGANNGGKTSILKCILELQNSSISSSDARTKENQIKISMTFSGGWPRDEKGVEQNGFTNIDMIFNKNGTSTKNLYNPFTSSISDFTKSPDKEPNNLIYPFLAKRKTNIFDQAINANAAKSVRGDLYNLIAKIDNLIDSGQSKHDKYKNACIDTLGFYVHCKASENGKKAGFLVNESDFLTIESMGEGVSNLLGMIVNLCVAKDQILVIEELENDIHPKALKSLLSLIAESSNSNQFFISTHSNIILSKLGSLEGSKIFGVSSKLVDRVPTSIVTELNDSEDRRIVLEELGYELDDLGLWKGWLILEESSAETIINSYLIPWFVPNLIGKLRTLSSNGYHRAKNKFDKLHEQFLYLHLSPVYKNKAWVILDAGQSESAEIEKMKTLYVEKHSWNDENFRQFSKHDFENYYPSQFMDQIQKISELKKEDRKALKENLLIDTLKWINGNPEEAKKELSISAKEVIDILKQIESSLNKS
ncbi:MAG: AAA family ATPase [Cyclobacteriaceae bacterium]|nr:AAA family ATPase [Cyclobacteriaceae bacterium]